jgi:hypothetical protein
VIRLAALGLLLVATACKHDPEVPEPTSGPTLAQAGPVVPGYLLVGVVDGPPWLAGRSPDHAPWSGLRTLDASVDIVPIDLQEPVAVDVLIAPLLSAMTTAQVDALRRIIGQGVPCVLPVDPLPVAWPVATPGELQAGDSQAFLGELGVTWREDVFLCSTAVEQRGCALVESTGRLEGIRFAFAGFIAARPDAVGFEALATLRGSVGLARVEDHIQHHPLYGPSLAGNTLFDIQPTEHVEDPVLAARVRADTTDVIVVADADWMAIDGDALAQVVRVLAGELPPPASTVDPSAPLLRAGSKVSSIDVIDRGWDHGVYTREDGVERIEAIDRMREEGKSIRFLRIDLAGEAPSVVGAEGQRSIDGARVEAFRNALEATKLEAMGGAFTLLDPALDRNSTGVRIILRDDAGITLADFVVSAAVEGAARHLVRGTFDDAVSSATGVRSGRGRAALRRADCRARADHRCGDLRRGPSTHREADLRLRPDALLADAALRRRRGSGRHADP